ncbi:asparagine synthase-related protein [Rossellomorea aquimaris]|uniref:asparagine synthase-related protein n=1 Tax=Rossellomorea aquimaris TaxID=189382 RepID=UPI0007D05AE9|nr:asparagine synthase-related protein [Rossellomorea aquimaris]
MSAITGIYNLNQEPIQQNQICKIKNIFTGYPRDDWDVWQNQNIFLGCLSQWITPESIKEVLPYKDYHRQLVITADAIIDNRKELFDKLNIDNSLRGGIPDSQLILLAYSKWGEETPKHLLGDFAFAIWDIKKKKLFAARDFSGARTLYFFKNEQTFAFSTTIHPLFTLPFVKKELNEEWMAQFLAIPTVVEAVDMFSTVYKNIQQVPPSHSVTVINGNISLRRYCTIEPKEKLKLKTNEEYEEAFRDVFQKAVKARTQTYGEVGAQLSGGLDSGTVVSFAAKELLIENKKLHTYSYIPEETFKDWTPKYYIPDERPFIKETVNHVGNIVDHYLNFDGGSPLSEVDDFLELMEMPYKFYENSFWLKGITEQAHKKGIKVLLNGARGNHSISWGSYGLNMEYYASLLKKLRWIQLYQELDLFTNNFSTGKSNLIPVVAKKAFPKVSRLLSNNKKSSNRNHSLINPDFAEKMGVFTKLSDHKINIYGQSTENLKDYRKRYYQQLFVWNKSGVANTNLSLRYSLWDRDPTNDLRVINFCLAIPEEKYVQGGMERSFIRNATKNILPDKVRLNHHIRGIQAADTIHRMKSTWKNFIEELHQLMKDGRLDEMINMKVFKGALSKLENDPKPEFVFTDEFKTLTRSLIVYRFMKSF